MIKATFQFLVNADLNRGVGMHYWSHSCKIFEGLETFGIWVGSEAIPHHICQIVVIGTDDINGIKRMLPPEVPEPYQFNAMIWTGVDAQRIAARLQCYLNTENALMVKYFK